MDLVVIGHVSIDHIRYPNEEEILIPGGGAAAVATSASLTNSSVGLVTRVGNDFPSDWMEELDSYLNIEGIKELDGETINIEMIYHEDGSVEAPVSEIGVAENIGEVTIPRTYENSKLYHLAPTPPKDQLKLINRLKGNQISLDFNPTYMEQYRNENKLLKEIISKVDIIFPNEREARVISEEEDLREAAKVFHDWGVGLVVITIGEKGGIIYDGEKFKEFRALPITEKEVVDHTGAGDSFIGGFLSKYVREKPIDNCIKEGKQRSIKVLKKKGSWSIKCPLL